MSGDRSFERNARVWLELGPKDPPARVLEDVFLAIETIPQQRVLRIPWRLPRMTLSTRLATAALVGVLVAAGALLLLRPPSAQVGQPSVSPGSHSTASPAAADQVPVLLVANRPKGWIVFGTSGQPGGQPSPSAARQGIWLVKADGTGLHELAPGLSPKTSFDISPDGQTIVFTTGAMPGGGTCSVDPCPGSRLWQARTDGQGPAMPLNTGCAVSPAPTATACSESDPAFSPDGRKVAFVRLDGAAGDPAGYTNVVGSYDVFKDEVRFLESTRSPDTRSSALELHSRQPAWSPDGSQIAFQQFIRNWNGPAASQPYDEARIKVVNADGTGLHELPVGATNDNAGPPAWLANGLIVFSTGVDYFGSPATAAGDFYSVQPDGTHLVSLCATGGCLGGGAYPTSTPDGQRILFWTHGTWAVMDPDGGHAALINPAGLTFSNMPIFGSVARLQAAP